MANIHKIPSYLNLPTDPIKILVVGCGGTGSLLLSNLARLNDTLIKIGHTGIKLLVVDDDIVEPHNVGRQLFYPSDVGESKALSLVTRINHSFGFTWKAIHSRFKTEQAEGFNIIVTCVDNLQARKEVDDMVNLITHHKTRLEDNLYYWIDCGNGRNYGQVNLSTVSFPKTNKLKSVFELFKKAINSKSYEPELPSCSTIEALRKQDLFINSFVALSCAEMVYSILTKPIIDYNTTFINTEQLSISKKFLT